MIVVGAICEVSWPSRQCECRTKRAKRNGTKFRGSQRVQIQWSAVRVLRMRVAVLIGLATLRAFVLLVALVVSVVLEALVPLALAVLIKTSPPWNNRGRTIVPPPRPFVLVPTIIRFVLATKRVVRMPTQLIDLLGWRVAGGVLA